MPESYELGCFLLFGIIIPMPPLNNFLSFKGRLSLANYWKFFLYLVIPSYFVVSYFPFGDNFLSIILFLLFLPITVRRLHDVNKSGILLLPLVFIILFSLLASFFNLSLGIIALSLAIFIALPLGFFIFKQLFSKGDEGENKYGFPESETILQKEDVQLVKNSNRFRIIRNWLNILVIVPASLVILGMITMFFFQDDDYFFVIAASCIFLYLLFIYFLLKENRITEASIKEVVDVNQNINSAQTDNQL
jgi:uncharacterized membrane protein YhaH (DUF805 family)